MTALRALPPRLVYSVDERPLPFRVGLLRLQYAVMAAIYLVLVVIILRHTYVTLAARVQAMGIACVGLAVGGLLQALPRGPVGSGFLAPPVFSAVSVAPSVLAAEVGGMPLAFGITIFASFVEVVTALAPVQLRIVTTPVLSGLIVFVVGLQLGVVGIGQMLDVRHEGLAAFSPHLVVTILPLAVCPGAQHPKAPEPKTPALSAVLESELEAHRTAGLQAELARQPELALRVLLHALAVAPDPLLHRRQRGKQRSALIRRLRPGSARTTTSALDAAGLSAGRLSFGVDPQRAWPWLCAPPPLLPRRLAPIPARWRRDSVGV